MLSKSHLEDPKSNKFSFFKKKNKHHVMRASSNEYISFVCFYAAGIGFLCKPTISQRSMPLTTPPREFEQTTQISNPFYSHLMCWRLICWFFLTWLSHIIRMDLDEKLNFIIGEKKKACSISMKNWISSQTKREKLAYHADNHHLKIETSNTTLIGSKSKPA